MSSQRYSPEFKDEAVRQVIERGHPVAEVAKGLGVSAHRLYKWVKGVKPSKTDQHASELVEAKGEILRLRAQLRRTEEERDILKKAAAYFAREPEQSTRS
jgi:transposase